MTFAVAGTKRELPAVLIRNKAIAGILGHFTKTLWLFFIPQVFIDAFVLNCSWKSAVT
jgi:hypothetical protein